LPVATLEMLPERVAACAAAMETERERRRERETESRRDRERGRGRGRQVGWVVVMGKVVVGLEAAVDTEADG
jgi:hypothetical protein